MMVQDNAFGKGLLIPFSHVKNRKKNKKAYGANNFNLNHEYPMVFDCSRHHQNP